MSDFNISPLDRKLEVRLRQKINQKTKPLGALGRLEDLALQLGLIQQTDTPFLNRPQAFVFAADHGITAENTSMFPQAVTAQMVMNFINGGAAINVFARQTGFALHIVDAGVNADFASDLPIVHCKIAKGTANFLHTPAMSQSECQLAITCGAELVHDALASGTNVLAFGEMGIGNTTSAAALMSVLCDIPPHQCVGRGTGLDDAGVAHKADVIALSISKHQTALTTPFAVLAHLGGFEIAMMVGAMLQAASNRGLILVDGFICSAAALVASKVNSAVLDYCVFAHTSHENGHAALLNHLKVRPLFDMQLRLGEGTGAVLAYPFLQAACNFLNEMASFESAGVSESNG